MNNTFSCILILLGILSFYIKDSLNITTYGSFFKFHTLSSSLTEFYTCEKSYQNCIKIGTLDPANMQSEALESLSTGITWESISKNNTITSNAGKMIFFSHIL